MPKNTKKQQNAQFKEFSLTKQKLDLDRTVSELRKPILKNQIKKFKKKQKINLKMLPVKKNHQREMEIWCKQKTMSRMNYEWIRKTI